MIKLINEINDISYSTFDCGEEHLNEYLKKYAKKNSDNNISKTYLLIENEIVIGYVSLAAASLDFNELPKDYEKLPKYPIPCLRIARLAIDKNYQGKHYGKELLAFALNQALIASLKIGIKFVVVDAKEDAKEFYEKYGFKALSGDKNKYILPTELILKAILR